MTDDRGAGSALAAEAAASTETAAAAVAAGVAQPPPPPEAPTAGMAASDATVAVAAPAAATAAATRRSGAVAMVTVRRLLRAAFAVALFGLGVVAGQRAYTLSQPPAPVVGDPGIADVPPTAIVAELANAIAAEDNDAIRAAMTQEIFDGYTSELQQYGIAGVERVESLGTFVDGPRSATMLVLHARTVDGNPFTLYLVVQTQDGVIVRLR
jgi:hypothetical protein